MKIKLFFEATDRRKATKALHHTEGILYSSPNLAELREMAHFLSPSSKTTIEKTKDLNEIMELAKIVSQVIDFIIVTMGAQGVIIIKCLDRAINSKTLVINHYPIKALSQVESVSGAGDCFASGFIHGMLSGRTEAENVFIGFESAKKALFCKSTVPKDLANVTQSISKAECLTYKVNSVV